MESIKEKKILEDQVVVGVVFVVMAIILITAIVLMVALNMNKTHVRGETGTIKKVSNSCEAARIHTSG